MKVTVHRKAHFNAAHRLHNASWSTEKNKAVFGKCNNEHYHGHNYELIVSVKGDIDPETGYVIDMGFLKKLMYHEIEEQFDHKNLNEEVSFFKNLNPSAENISVVIWNILRPHIDEKLELGVTLYETPRNFVHYTGE